jgi:hypothetical protein
VRAYSNYRFGLTFRLGLAGCLAISTGCSALAQDRETWRCEAPNGHYDVTHLPIGDQAKVITGWINCHRADFGPEWNSIAKIGFTDSKLIDGDCHCDGLYVQAFDKEQAVALALLVDGNPKESFPVGGTFDYPIPFKITVDPNGLVTLQVGKKVVQTDTAMLPHAERDTLMMSCSGGDVSFLNVKAS